MAGSAVRRPLPALVALIALLLLTGLVWWRVIDRDTGTRADAHRSGCASPASAPSSSDSPSGAVTVTLPRPSAVDVQVLNSTNRSGIAGKARSALVRAGFRSPRPASNFTGHAKITGVGQIRFAPASKAAARLVGYYLPGATLVPTSATPGTVTVVLGPRYRAVLTGAEAQRALTAHRTTTSATPKPSSTPSC